MADNRFQVKRTNVTGRVPNTTHSSNSQYIAAGELALNMTDQLLYTSDGSELITIGAIQAIGKFSDQIIIGSISTGLLTINSTAIFAGNLSVNTVINTSTISVSNNIGNSSVTPLSIYVGNTTANCSVDMNVGITDLSISFASVNSSGIAVIQTSVNHGLSLVNQPKVTVNSSVTSLNTQNYSVIYNPGGFDIIDIPTSNTITVSIPTDNFKQTAPGYRTIRSLSRTNGVVTVVTAGAHSYQTGDTIYVPPFSSNAKFPFQTTDSGATVTYINTTTLSYTQSQYVNQTIDITGRRYVLPAANTSLAAADQFLQIFYPNHPFLVGDYIYFSGVEPLIYSGTNVNNRIPYYLDGVFQVTERTTGSGAYFKIKFFTKPKSTIGQNLVDSTFTSGYATKNYDETVATSGNPQLSPIITNASTSGTIRILKPTGISIQNGPNIVRILDTAVYVGNTSQGWIVDSKGSRSFRPQG